ncbi:transposase, partial [Stigmatella erecta]
MEKELEQFRQEVERLNAGRKKGALPYPEALRAFAVRYVEHTVGTGGTMSQAAKSLGVSEPTLYTWKKGERAAHRRAKGPGPKQELVPVVVSKSAG